MNFFKLAFCVSVIGLMSACAAPHFEGRSIPLDQISVKPKVLIIKNESTKKGFLSVIENWFNANGYTYIIKPDNSPHDLDKITIEYDGVWRWDLAIFLNSARIEAFYKGQRVGRVDYNAPNNLNTNKYCDAGERIEYMLDVLFGKISSIDATRVINHMSSNEFR